MNEAADLRLRGIHHLTAVTADVSCNVKFYAQTLGLRLVKKTVNQDDVSAYHLFFADGRGSPGTDITFFHWPLPREGRGGGSVVRTIFRVAGERALHYWAERFKEHAILHGSVEERAGRPYLAFEDHEGQRLGLVADEADTSFSPWERSDVPPHYQLRGLGPIVMSVQDLAPTAALLENILHMNSLRQYSAQRSDGAAEEVTVYVFGMAQQGAAGELHIAVEPSLERASGGAGGVHHVAFRVPTFEDYEAWNIHLRSSRVRTSGPVDRFYFRSVYFREPGGVLFELATDGPGFHADEPIEHLGEKLSLPPFLEARRREIEAQLKPLPL